MFTMKSYILTLSIIATLFVGVTLAVKFQPQPTLGEANILARVASSTNPAVTSTPVIVFATSTCVARVVTTYASPVMMGLRDVVPSATFGLLQPASTTVVYPAETFGCSSVRIYSFTNQSITVTETR